MDATRIVRPITVALLAVVVAVVLVQAGILPGPWTHDRATVTITDGDGTTRVVVDAEVADTLGERHTGLSDHESLERGEGMLFVHWQEDDRTYVMRDMDFAIDIVFVGADGRITTVHHARAPDPGEDGETLRYSGRAKWVLEVPRGVVNETGIEVGDEVHVSYEG